MRLIDADALIAQMEADAEQMEDQIAIMFTYAAINDVKHAPTIEERKTGKWIYEERKRLIDETDDGAVYSVEKWWKCSECGVPKGYIGHKPTDRFCYDCGASMMEGEQP